MLRKRAFSRLLLARILPTVDFSLVGNFVLCIAYGAFTQCCDPKQVERESAAGQRGNPGRRCKAKDRAGSGVTLIEFRGATGEENDA